MYLSLWDVVLVCHLYDVCENSVDSVYIGGYGGLSESELCVFRELCPVILVVDECPSVLLMIVHVELSTMSDCIVC